MLLGKWTEFARASVAFKHAPDGAKWRDATASIIALQAVAMALSESAELSHDERALACDRAALLIEHHEKLVGMIWLGAELPRGIAELIHDARENLSAARAVT
jgi:hypothetical protein